MCVSVSVFVFVLVYLCFASNAVVCKLFEGEIELPIAVLLFAFRVCATIAIKLPK